MLKTRPLTHHEVELLETYKKLHRAHVNYNLRKSVLSSSVELADAIAQSIYDVSTLESNDLKVLSFLSGVKSRAYQRSADLPTAIRWFEILRNKALSNLNESLST